MQEVLNAQNVKCGGCASAIRNGLLAIEGIEQVEVEIESGQVTIEGPTLDPAQIRAKLDELGYPEA